MFQIKNETDKLIAYVGEKDVYKRQESYHYRFAHVGEDG